eukprot:m.136974 g.136974  ORF g.136974 m.136974 type:complete len:219 (+) comp23974_c0_seq9:65-721(+)
MRQRENEKQRKGDPTERDRERNTKAKLFNTPLPSHTSPPTDTLAQSDGLTDPTPVVDTVASLAEAVKVACSHAMSHPDVGQEPQPLFNVVSKLSRRRNRTMVSARRQISIDNDDVDAPWFHGLLQREVAERRLMNYSSLCDGLFLIRESPSNPNRCVLSVAYNAAVLHRRIDFTNGQFVNAKGQQFPSLAAVVAAYSSAAISVPVVLTRPCPRPPSIS